MENTNLFGLPKPLPLDSLTNYHNQLTKQFGNPGNQIPSNPNIEKLMAFNGYYSLNIAKGAFFAIDTNIIVRPQVDPVYDLSLLISLDGTSSARYPFTGTFDGIRLIQHKDVVGTLAIDLTFTRNSSSYGPTAICAGSITLPEKTPVKVIGNTYNNPIPASLFIGDYYYSKAPNQKVLSIKNNNQLFYDGGINGAPLKPVNAYIYNFNMYYFSFKHRDAMVKLIMGTASSQGFACNNMSVTGKGIVSRALYTIPSGSSPSKEIPYIGSSQFPDLSGYYQIPLPGAPLAFLSIQAKYHRLPKKAASDLYFVMISYSWDGHTSTGYFFDTSKGMDFDNAANTLTVPAASGQPPLTLTFTRQYNKNSGSLVNVKGVINGVSINGSTFFNPVPLSFFGGVSMTNNGGDRLTINGDNTITFNNTHYASIIYVPLMYIVAAPTENVNLLLSLGTDGLRGNACIVTTNPLKNSIIKGVYAINGLE